MRSTRLIAASAIGLATVLAISACSASSTGGESTDQTSSQSEGQTESQSSGDTESQSETPAEGRTLTVWAMNGDLSPETLAEINKRFEAETGATVDLQMQQWDNIITKVTTALATNDAPDVLDLGNTQVPIYAANAGLADLTEYKADLQQGQTWLDGLESPATQGGSLYGVPSFAGDRAVIYNKKMWAEAGVTEEPTNYDEFTAALDKIAEKFAAPDFSAFYYPARYDFGPLGFVWDAGGQIATEQDGAWAAGFSSPEAQAGLEAFKAFQNKYSVASSQGVSENDPEQAQILADGRAGAILGISSEIDSIKKANPDLTDDDLGTFPFPGLSGENQPVMLGGSVWGVAQKSTDQDLAVKWIKIAASPEIQTDWVYGHDKWIPNSTEAIDAAINSGSMPRLTAGFFNAALRSNATPAAANWPTIEADHTLRDFFSAVASGSKTPQAAAEEFDAHIDDVLNKG